MTERLCAYDQDNHDLRGKPTPEYVALYEQWGQGEIGIIVLGESFIFLLQPVVLLVI